MVASSNTSPLLLDLLTEGPLGPAGLQAGSAHFLVDPPEHALFDVYIARWSDSPLRPIDRGIAGHLIHTERVPNIGEGGEVQLSAPSAFWSTTLALPFHGAVTVSYRVYEQARVNGPPAVVRTHELLFAPTTIDEHPTSQPALHSGHLFSCGPLGFALVAGDAVSRFARNVEDGNVLARFTTTEEASPFLKRGELLPVLGIHAWTYRLVLSPRGLSIHERVLLGLHVVQRRYRVAAAKHVDLVDGASLEHFNEPRVLESIAWPLRGETVDFGGFTTGGHGDGLVPTYLMETGAGVLPLSEPCINEDLGELYERKKRLTNH